jgi:hypothetical protein
LRTQRLNGNRTGFSKGYLAKRSVYVQITLDALDDAEAIADETAEEIALPPLLAALLA